MPEGAIEANKEILHKVFSENFWFLIPEYQRSYVWKTDNINDLLDDLYFAFIHKPDNDYFLGSLVLKKYKEISFPEFEVLDGQQRLTTFFIMLAVLRDLIVNQQFKNTLQKKIFQEESVLENIPSRSRITYKIRDNVENFIQEFIIKPEGTSDISTLKAYVDSEGDNVSILNMANAILVMHEHFAKQKQESSLEEFVKFVFNKTLFIYVSTENTEDAFRLFTILNNRGIPLTNADILKSQNIGALPTEREKNKYAKIWEDIEGKHGNDFDRFLQFLRTILVQEKARANLLEEFNDKIYQINSPQTPLLKQGKDTFDFVNKYNDIYEEVIELQNENLSNSIKNLLTIMKIGLRSEDWIPPLMHYYAKFGTDKLEKFLKKLEYKFTGDWVCGITPTVRLDAMNSILKAIDQTNRNNLESLLGNMSLFKINTEDFKNNIQGYIYKKQYTRYLLLKIEYLSGDNTVHLSNYQYITVEHILPQNPPKNSQWVRDFREESRQYWTNRIANLVLISQKKNSALSNQDFEKKKKIYLRKRIDAFSANKVFIEQNSSWTPEVLKRRQAYLIGLLLKSV
ncbi:DUF262 domain-containing protein [Paenibacillus albidus]|uniref:DUF262 domain-containing protein n=1 Tax=Paenibacillus albidus TaxID=2041023 RepID=UPI001BE80111|nr:DUF262 domain-containing protein [Paenibacillus albidus]MBT2290159.1 DUF262 domain-containing protein [Paenibacillus albidus]